jgi:peptide/nickel transport system substrate-binding protein
MKRHWSFLARLALGSALVFTALPAMEARAQSALSQSGLVGTPEGITIITDEAQWPTELQRGAAARRAREGWQAAAGEGSAAAGPHGDPAGPDEIGKYGGTWRRGFTGPGDNENGNRINASDRPILVDHTGAKPNPSLAKSWKMSDDGKIFTLNLRRGLRWSDGAPMTANDFVFWFEDIYGNKDIVPTPIPDMSPQGKPGRIVKVDDYTVNFEFDVPFYLFEDLMAGDTLIGGGQAVRQSDKRSHGAYAPAHYLKQFLPKYAPGGLEGRMPRRGPRASTTGSRACTSRRTGRSTPSCRFSDRSRRCSRSIARPGSWSAIRTTGRSTRPATSCPTLTAS